MKSRPTRRKPLPFSQVHDLSAIKKYVWRGDRAWVARQTGITPYQLTAYLKDRQRPTTEKTRWAWQLLLKRAEENKAFATEHPGERPKRSRLYREIKHPQLRHIHDLFAIKKYVWPGDKPWAAHGAGISRTLFTSYLEGKCSPATEKTRLAWRLLLAKVANNKAFAAEWQQSELRPSSKAAFKAAWKALPVQDKLAVAHFLKMFKGKEGCFAYVKVPELTEEQYAKLGAAVVLRTKYARRLKEQVAPWLKERNYGATQA